MKAYITRSGGDLTVTLEGVTETQLARTVGALDNYNAAAPGRHDTFRVAEVLADALRTFPEDAGGPRRMPDPTLFGLRRAVLVGPGEGAAPHVAHVPGNACSGGLSMGSDEAAYVAVPCRNHGCFPDAPPPGQRYVEGETTQAWVPTRDLGWQVPDDGGMRMRA